MKFCSLRFTEEPPKVPPGNLPVLLGGHMRPGPPSEPNWFPEPRYCEAPCPQECAPACYEWCCFNSIQPPQPPVQIMMVPVPNQLNMQLRAPSPLPYPMQLSAGGAMACPQMPCSSKKTQVSKANEKKLALTEKNKAANYALNKTESHSVATATVEKISGSFNKLNNETNTASTPTISNLANNSTISNNTIVHTPEHLTKNADKKHSLHRF